MNTAKISLFQSHDVHVKYSDDNLRAETLICTRSLCGKVEWERGTRKSEEGGGQQGSVAQVYQTCFRVLNTKLTCRGGVL